MGKGRGWLLAMRLSEASGPTVPPCHHLLQLGRGNVEGKIGRLFDGSAPARSWGWPPHRLHAPPAPAAPAPKVAAAASYLSIPCASPHALAPVGTTDPAAPTAPPASACSTATTLCTALMAENRLLPRRHTELEVRSKRVKFLLTSLQKYVYYAQGKGATKHDRTKTSRRYEGTRS
jgi:hypothetical protein